MRSFKVLAKANPTTQIVNVRLIPIHLKQIKPKDKAE
jgi:hypothetical protein